MPRGSCATPTTSATIGDSKTKAEPPKKAFGSDLYPDPAKQKSSGFKNPFGSEKERYADLTRTYLSPGGKKAPAPKKRQQPARAKKDAAASPTAEGGLDLGVILGGGFVAFAAVLASQAGG